MAYCFLCTQDVELPCSNSLDSLSLLDLNACEHYFKKSQSLIPCIDPSEIEFDFFNLENTLACMFCRKCFSSNKQLDVHLCDGREKARVAPGIDKNSALLVILDDESLEYPGYE